MCCATTDEINKFSEEVGTTIGPLSIDSRIFVDDVASLGDENTIRNSVNGCCYFERFKKFTFSTEKSKILRFGKSKDQNEYKVKKGKIDDTDEYKYLGDIIQRNGKKDKTVGEKIRKCRNAVHYIMKWANSKVVGDNEINIRIRMFEAIVIPILLNNTETWGILSKKVTDELESIQKEAVTKLMKQKVTTSYDGILCELGMWKVIHRINEKRLMYIHNVLNSEDGRQAKEVMRRFINDKMNNTWSDVVMKLETLYGIEVKDAEMCTKKEWKKKVENKINRIIEEERREKKKIHTKLKYCEVDNFKPKEYLLKLKNKDAIKMLELRLQMNDVKTNFKGRYNQDDMKCPLCLLDDDTNEHQINCSKVKDVTIKNGKEYNYYLNTKDAEEISQFLRKVRINEEMRME